MKKKLTKLIKPFLNFIVFHGGWWGIILLAIYKPTGYLPLLFTISILSSFLHFKYVEKNFKAEFFFLISAFTLGILTEVFLLNIYAFRYELVPVIAFKLPPAWIFCLWTIFPFSIGYSLSFLYKLRLPGMLLGAALTTFTYSAGESLDLVFFTEPRTESMAYFCGVWFALLALLFKLRERLHKKYPS